MKWIDEVIEKANEGLLADEKAALEDLAKALASVPCKGLQSKGVAPPTALGADWSGSIRPLVEQLADKTKVRDAPGNGHCCTSYRITAKDEWVEVVPTPDLSKALSVEQVLGI